MSVGYAGGFHYQVDVLVSHSVVTRLWSDGRPRLWTKPRSDDRELLFNNLPGLPASNFRYPESPEALGEFAPQLGEVIRQNSPTNCQGVEVLKIQVKNALFAHRDRDRQATEAVLDLSGCFFTDVELF